MASSYQPDDYDLLVFVDKLRDRVAFRGRIDRQRPSLWAEIKATNTAYVVSRLIVLAGFLGVLAVLVRIPS